MRKVTVAAIQMACSPDAAENRRTAEAMVRQAAGNGAQIILLPELFETPYFCQERRYASYELATTPAENPAIAQLRKVAAELQVVLPVSFYEKAGTALYNSIAIIDADGSVLGISGRHTFRMTISIRKNSTSPPATPASKSGTPAMPESAWASAGISGFRRLPAAWLSPVQNCCSTPRQSARSDSGGGQCSPLAALHAGTCRRKPDAGDRCQPHRHRAHHPR